MSDIFSFLKKPLLYQSSPDNIWNSRDLAELVLQSYLQSDIPGGSLSEEHIKDNIQFIQKNIAYPEYKKVLDVGCGIGRYCEKLTQLGYSIQGIDLSQIAIEYARAKTKKNKTGLTYIHQDILDYDTNERYDFILLLYGTYSTFSLKKRKELLHKLYSLLKNKGIILFDVPNIRHFERQKEINFWEYFSSSNLYSEDPFLLLFSINKYPNNILLNRSIYSFSESKKIVSYEWIKNFEKEEIVKEIENSNFKVKKITENIKNDLDNIKSDSFHILIEK